MSRQDANAAFARTSFLYGGNAGYIEDLYARYESDPKTVDAAWQSFFESLREDRADVERNARAPSWRRPDWPLPQANELAGAAESARESDWRQAGAAIAGKLQASAQARGIEVTTAEVERATRDSIHPRSARA
jgi:2-oxoglutarate dehydrogenase E1 component